MSTLVRISRRSDHGWSNVLVTETHAKSLHRHILSFGGVGVTTIQDTDFPSVCVEADGDGAKQVVIETLDKTFSVNAAPKDLAPVIMNWVRSGAQELPR